MECLFLSMLFLVMLFFFEGVASMSFSGSFSERYEDLPVLSVILEETRNLEELDVLFESVLFAHNPDFLLDRMSTFVLELNDHLSGRCRDITTFKSAYSGILTSEKPRYRSLLQFYRSSNFQHELVSALETSSASLLSTSFLTSFASLLVAFAWNQKLSSQQVDAWYSSLVATMASTLSFQEETHTHKKHTPFQLLAHCFEHLPIWHSEALAINPNAVQDTHEFYKGSAVSRLDMYPFLLSLPPLGPVGRKEGKEGKEREELFPSSPRSRHSAFSEHLPGKPLVIHRHSFHQEREYLRIHCQEDEEERLRFPFPLLHSPKENDLLSFAFQCIPLRQPLTLPTPIHLLPSYTLPQFPHLPSSFKTSVQKGFVPVYSKTFQRLHCPQHTLKYGQCFQWKLVKMNGYDLVSAESFSCTGPFYVVELPPTEDAFFESGYIDSSCGCSLTQEEYAKRKRANEENGVLDESDEEEEEEEEEDHSVDCRRCLSTISDILPSNSLICRIESFRELVMFAAHVKNRMFKEDMIKNRSEEEEEEEEEESEAIPFLSRCLHIIREDVLIGIRMIWPGVSKVKAKYLRSSFEEKIGKYPVYDYLIKKFEWNQKKRRERQKDKDAQSQPMSPLSSSSSSSSSSSLNGSEDNTPPLVIDYIVRRHYPTRITTDAFLEQRAFLLPNDPRTFSQLILYNLAKMDATELVHEFATHEFVVRYKTDAD